MYRLMLLRNACEGHIITWKSCIAGAEQFGGAVVHEGNENLRDQPPSSSHHGAEATGEKKRSAHTAHLMTSFDQHSWSHTEIDFQQIDC